jgi:hypothetical protein
MKNRAYISLDSIHFKNEFHSFQKWIPASELYSIGTVMKFDVFWILNAWYMHNFFSPFLNRLRLDPAIFGLADLIDDHHAIQPTVLETQNFNLLFGRKYSTINEEQTLMNFINIGDGSSCHQAAMLRSFGVWLQPDGMEFIFLSSFLKKSRNLVTKEWNTSDCDEYWRYREKKEWKLVDFG